MGKANKKVSTRCDPSDNNEPVKTVTVSKRKYEVERILDKRIEKNRIEYLLKWKGFPLKASTWEPLHHINAPELIREYDRKLGKRIRFTLYPEN